MPVAHSRPLIAVVGSVDAARTYPIPLRNPPLAEQACGELGRELALAGCDLLIFSTKEIYVERVVALAYASTEQPTPGAITVRPAGSQPSTIELPDSSTTRLRVEPDTGDEWELPFLRSIVEADGLVVIGGGRSTRIAGMIAILCDIPALPVATFGAGAMAVWENLQKHGADATDEDIALYGQSWSTQSARLLVASLMAQVQRKRDRITASGRGATAARRRRGVGALVAALALVAAVATIPIATRDSLASPAGVTLLLAGPLLAAIGGGLVRNSFLHDQWGWAAVRALGAGVVTVLLYIASQLLMVTETAGQIDWQHLLFFVVPLGFITGFTFDLVFDRLRAAKDDHGSAADARPGDHSR